ncbi:MAG: sigma-70 family RNA polymerase sigma factor [Tepidisphaeraceae bacterium]
MSGAKPNSLASDGAPSLRLADHQPGQRQTQLLQLAKSGDRAAFGELVRAVQARLYNAVFRIVGDVDDALELTQETFAKALDKVSDFRGDCAAYTWLFRIAMNLSISKLRADKVRRAYSIDAESKRPTDERDDQMTTLRARIAGTGRGPSEDVEHKERLGLVTRALGQLDPTDRAILVMRDIDGLDYAEMAGVLDVPLGTLKSKLFRARMALRERFESIGGK